MLFPLNGGRRRSVNWLIEPASGDDDRESSGDKRHQERAFTVLVNVEASRSRVRQIRFAIGVAGA
jgi:hypothetical protein